MARQDLVGLLTGVQSRQQPISATNPQDWRMQFGQRQSEKMNQRLRGLTGRMSTQEALGAGLSQLDLSTPDGLRTVAKLQQSTGNLAGAAQTAARIKQMQDEIEQQKLKQQQAAAALASREDVADQVRAAGYGKIADAIVSEAGSGKENALKAGLDIIKKKGETAKTVNLVDTRTDKTIGSAVERDGRLFLPGSSTPLTNEQLRGVGVSDSYVKPSSALVTTKLTPQQEQEQRALESQGNMFEITSGEVNPAIDKAASARQVLSTVNKGIATGIVPDFLANQGAILQGTLEAMGVTNIPTGISTGVLNQSELKNIQNKGMLPFIEQQGRGWTDTDRVNYYKTSAGYTQPWQYNEIVATADLQNSINTIEKHQFANTRKNLTTVTPLASTTLWNDYLKRVPRSKVIQDFEREGTGFTYDKVTVVDDGANLSQYWVEDQPIGFKMQLGDQIVDLDWKDVKDSAEKKQQTVREWLADREFAGHIIQGNY